MNPILLCLSVLLLSGCLTPEPVVTSRQQANDLVNSLSYTKAKNGLCFGVATVSKFATNGTLSESVVIVQVDCEKVSL